ncbi:hypothetical protein E2C01_092511 [Portunus trituberculatus]|uniref:Uncharacterized protein n=1 Tax=Portunus trituberculatus TaxID=210409 RepID=A0A5B7JKA4_PORTR|nr:hypothetical protein [Portunus trituberculatus]
MQQQQQQQQLCLIKQRSHHQATHHASGSLINLGPGTVLSLVITLGETHCNHSPALYVSPRATPVLPCLAFPSQPGTANKPILHACQPASLLHLEC